MDIIETGWYSNDDVILTPFYLYDNTGVNYDLADKEYDYKIANSETAKDIIWS